ncbi:ferredoxin [Nocardia sp. NBC_01327]|uniref:ferredoxin n=1 Tax=Nocardia sp. NBC_01327 TaxID=2903593 RepID=UPI002E13FA6F|nr:ferredoxin [Nocardia sp. NBC_01327]
MTRIRPSGDVSRLHIDWTRCDGRGLCTELLPEILDRDDWGYPLLRSHPRDTTIAARHSAAARDAVALCPRLALTLIPLDHR